MEFIDDDEEDYTFKIQEKPQTNPSTVVDPESDSESSDDSDLEINPEMDEPIVIETPVVKEGPDGGPDSGPDSGMIEEVVIEEFTFEELPENIMVLEEALIPESKVIENDEIQSADMFNQMVKMSSDLDKNIMNQKKRVLKSFNLLKQTHSVIDDNGNILQEKLKGDSWKPFEKLLKSQMFIPIVNEEKRTFDYKLEEDDEIVSGTLSNQEFYSTYMDIENKYKKGENRFNFSMYSYLTELYNLLDAYEPTNPGFKQALTQDTEVYSNTFTNDIETLGGRLVDIHRHRLNGPIGPVKANEMSVIGYIRLLNPENINSNTVLRNKAGTKNVELKKSFDIVKVEPGFKEGEFVYFKNKLNEGGVIQEIIDNNNFKINDKVYNANDIMKISNVNTTNKAFVFENTDSNSLVDYLDLIVPSVNNIIPELPEDITSIQKFKDLVDTYNLDLDDFTSNNLKHVYSNITKNIGKLKKLSENYGNYDSKPQKRDNFIFISNKALDTLKPYYGEYPYFNSGIDGPEKRIEFLFKQPDHGVLFFKMIIENIESTLRQNQPKMLSIVNKKIGILEAKLENSRNEINKLNSNNNACGKYRITNVYYSKEQLEKSFDKKIEIDSPMMKHKDSQRFVESGNFALLFNPDSSINLYKRTNKNKWVLETENADSILKENKALCSTMGTNIKEMNNSYSFCKYDTKENKCMDISYLKHRDTIETLETNLNILKSDLNKLQNYDKVREQNLEYLETLKNKAQLEFSKKLRVQRYYAKLYQQVEKETDATYQEFYDKIDTYMTSISGLPQEEFYKGLKILLDKYGRKAFEDENELNIYSSIGSKVLACNHHTIFIDFYENKLSSQELIEKVNERYGVFHDGYSWCKNCGQELIMDEFETIEGFTESGARLVSHEQISDEDTVNEDSNTGDIMVETLKQILLQGDNRSIKDNQTLSVVKIVDVLANMMGIKLSAKDTTTIYKMSQEILRTKIPNEDKYIASAQRKSKKALDIRRLKAAYKNFYNRNVILYTSSIYFVVIQSGVPPYTKFSNNKKCTPSLDGYPLESGNLNGIRYLVCILDTLKTTGSDWALLSKIKIRDELIKIIDLTLLKESQIQFLLDTKNHYLSKNKKTKIVESKLTWGNFRPSLENTKPNTDAEKYIALGNDVVSTKDVENRKYMPTPIDNFCCLDETDTQEYFFNQEPKMKSMFKKLEKRNVKTGINKNKIQMKPTNVSKIDSFTNILFSPEDLDEESIQSFCKTYDTSGIKYLFDESGICQNTGKSQTEIESIKYTKEDYMKLRKNLQVSKLITMNLRVSNEETMMLSSLLNYNKTLQGDEFLSNLDIKKKNVIEDVIINTKLLIKKIDKLVVDTMNLKIPFDLNDLLGNLGSTPNVIDNDLLSLYLTQMIHVPMQRLAYGYNIEKVKLPSSLGLNPEMTELIENIIIAKFEDLEEFSFITKEQLENALLILKTSTKYLNLFRGSDVAKSIKKYIVILIIYKILNAYNESLNLDALETLEEDYEDLDITHSIENKNYSVPKLMIYLLKNINDYHKLINKHDSEYIARIIEQQAENNKESNLKFIQELDRETWSSLKTMISLGMDTWKNLSNKNRNIYMPSDDTEPITESDERGSEQIENMSAEDLLAYNERDIMEDDDE